MSTDSLAVTVPTPAATLDRAGRANFFHRLSREAGLVAIRAAIAAGVELLAAKEEHPRNFREWIADACEFGKSTAYRYMDLATKTMALSESSLPALLEGSASDREAAIEAAAMSTDSRTLTDLYESLGIVKRTPGNMGGARPGAGRPPATADRNKIRADAIFSKERIGELADAVLQKRLHLYVSDPDRRAVILAVAKQLVQDFE